MFERIESYIFEIIESSIFEQYNLSLLKRYPDRGHLFWYPYSGVESKRIVLYHNRLNESFKKNNISEIESHNFSWIDMGSPVLHVDNPLKIIIKCISN